MEFSVKRYFLVILVLVKILHSSCRTTEKDPDPEEEIEIKFIVKRDASLETQGLPFVDGRTFRASEPINPNADTGTEQGDSPQPVFGEEFDTSQTIFQPEVDSSSDTGAQQQTGVNDGSRHTVTRTIGYAAQYPYYQTTSEGQASSASQTESYQPSSYTSYGAGYPSGSELLTRRRVQTYGSSTGTGTDYQRGPAPYSDDSGSANQNPGYQTQTRLVAFGSGGSSSGQRYSSRTGASVSSRGNYYDSSTGYRQRTTANGYGQYTGQSQSYIGNRLPDGSTYGSGIRYENGRYYDSAGHEVDPYGRHRDESGRLQSSSSTGTTQQGFPVTYDPIISQISDNPVCPSTNVRVRINGLLCQDAVRELGRFVCYNYERVSTECCERCLQVKNPSRVGCEYGDRSYQCRNIQPFDCYMERNRQICCDKCREYREQMQATAAPNCEYGDLTPRCLGVRQRSHLCYLPENQRLCCATCPRLANNEEQNCRWGNQSPELCNPFDEEGKLRLNCYIPAVQEVCCATCRRLRVRMRDEIPGCEYGDSPVQFSTGTEILDCAEYIGQFGVQNCDDSEIASKCCYTCYRYRAAGRG